MGVDSLGLVIVPFCRLPDHAEEPVLEDLASRLVHRGVFADLLVDQEGLGDVVSGGLLQEALYDDLGLGYFDLLPGDLHV